MARIEPKPVTAVVLAGGLARRFRGEDKGLLELAHRPLAGWVAERFKARVAEVLINANRNPIAYARLGFPVVPDYLPEHPGPLAGLLSAARTAQQDWLLCAPCDAPFLPLDLARQLFEHARSSQVPLARAADEAGTHYAIMLVHRDLMTDLETYMEGGGRQVRAWQERHPHETVYFGDDPYAFLNINTPEDLKTAERVAHRYQP